ncbi:MAG: hypothetical protein HY459_03785 [Parcubacteria group bacterium]|nr:hypothetical protein [Parcubacteria group bacterium]
MPEEDIESQGVSQPPPPEQQPQEPESAERRVEFSELAMPPEEVAVIDQADAQSIRMIRHDGALKTAEWYQTSAGPLIAAELGEDAAAQGWQENFERYYEGYVDAAEVTASLPPQESVPESDVGVASIPVETSATEGMETQGQPQIVESTLPKEPLEENRNDTLDWLSRDIQEQKFRSQFGYFYTNNESLRAKMVNAQNSEERETLEKEVIDTIYVKDYSYIRDYLDPRNPKNTLIREVFLFLFVGSEDAKDFEKKAWEHFKGIFELKVAELIERNKGFDRAALKRGQEAKREDQQPTDSP